jgi:hypothetical protein
MAFVTLFVPEDFQHPDPRSIHYHPSHYRRDAARRRQLAYHQWRERAGLSIWSDNGLDTGDVLMQKTPISDTHAGFGLFRPPSFPDGSGDDGIARPSEKGKAPRIKQDENPATYEGYARGKTPRSIGANPGGRSIG